METTVPPAAAPQTDKKEEAKLPKMYYDPLIYRPRTDIEPEFGTAYEGIVPDESEVRFIGNRLNRCYYYMHGLEICKYEVLKKQNQTFLPCKDAMDAMWRCFTDDQYGKTMEEVPDYVKPWKKEFLDCYFTKTHNMDFCWTYFANMIRTIYRRPDSKLSKWF